jgi:glutathione S-transferase
VTESGADFSTVNRNGYVPALRLDDSSVLTEGVAIVQYLADLKPTAALIPPAGTAERYHVQCWLTFIATELHKMYSPWLFHAEYGAQAKEVARSKIAERLAFVEDHLAASGPFIMGERFTVVDAYLFTIVGWSEFTRVDLAGFPKIRAFMAEVGSRPKVLEALAAEGLNMAGAQS